MSDFDWIEQHDMNPWEIYDAIVFDIEPTEEDLIKYVRMALSTHEIENRVSWDTNFPLGRYGVKHYINLFREEGFLYLRISSDGSLLTGTNEDYLVYSHVIYYSDLAGNQLTESEDDGLDWIRNTIPYLSFYDVKKNQTYGVKMYEPLFKALDSCEEVVSHYQDSVTVEVLDIDYLSRSNIYCDPDDDDRKEVITLYLKFIDNDNIRIGTFWVMEEMVDLYPIDYNLNESGDDWDWVRETPLNPWDMYDSIDFDIEPTDEDVNHYIELALETRKITNRSAWGTGRKFDINEIKSYSRNEDCELTIDEHGALIYGLKEYVKHIVNKIKYSELKQNTITESDDDGLDWIREIDPRPRIEVGRDYDVHNDYIYEFLEAVELSGLDIRWNSGDQPTTHYPIEDDRGSTVINIGNDHRLSYWSDYGNRDRTNLIKWPNIDHTITESDDFDWIRDTNPEDIDTITFFQQGKCYYMGKLINKDLGCIKFEKYDPKDTAHSYEDGRGLLTFGAHLFSPLFIEEMLKEKNLTLFDLETEENINLMESDEMDWIRNTEIPIQPGIVYTSKNIETLKYILQLIEDKFPKATWMSGSKPTKFFPDPITLRVGEELYIFFNTVQLIYFGSKYNKDDEDFVLIEL